MSGVLLDRVRGLLARAAASASTPPAAAELAAAAARVDEPLRVAVVGRVKAGKSTLVNALAGEELAPTDAAEATQVVTWYRYGSPRAVVHPQQGAPEQRRFDRRAGAVQVELGGAADSVRKVDVAWPSPRLRAYTLIDTPGLASLSSASERTVQFLSSDDERPTEADAVIYLLRHVHASDLRFLEAFHGDELVQGTPLNTVGVLSRADEVGVCRLDAMAVANRVAQRYAADARLRRLCPVVVPVAGLLAVAGATWRDDEFRALARVAAGPRDEVVDLLLSADAWATSTTRVGVTPMERRHLLDRLGLFGVRLAVQLVRSRQVGDAAGLGRELTERSGLNRLRQVVGHQFLARAQALKARSALATVQAVLDEGGFRDPQEVVAAVEAVRATAHEFTELRLLHLLRSGRVNGKPDRLAELERLLGGAGHAAAARLGVQLIRSRQVTDATGFARELTARSGMDRLRTVVEQQFLARAQALKARSALATVEAVLAEHGCSDADDLATEVETVRASAHEFRELRLLHLLRSGRVAGKAERLLELERLLGAAGHAPTARLDLPPDASSGEVRAAGYAALTRCRTLAEHPLASRELRRAAEGAARSCEGMLFDLESTAEGAPAGG